MQQHFNGSDFFNRSWEEMSEELGSVSGDYWLGLDKLHCLTRTGRCRLRIELLLANNTQYHDKYSTFRVDRSDRGFKLYVSGLSSGTEMSMFSSQNNSMFSTYDRDNDESSNIACAVTYGGGWWYRNCYLAGLNSSPNKWFAIYRTTTWVQFYLNATRMLLKCT